MKKELILRAKHKNRQAGNVPAQGTIIVWVRGTYRNYTFSSDTLSLVDDVQIHERCLKKAKEKEIDEMAFFFELTFSKTFL